jgi:hypothetical protein
MVKIFAGCWYSVTACYTLRVLTMLLQAVSMDGILFEVSGVISGGLEDLILKAKQWELSNEAARQRMDRKKKLENEMSEILKQCDKQQSLVKIRMETSGLKKMIDIAEKQKNAEVNIYKKYG